MSGFEFSFSLFGLLLGLALAEGLGGLSRALKARHEVRIGWLGPKGMFTVRVIVLTWSFFPISLVAISVRNRHIVMACLIWLIALYPLAAIWH